MFAQRDVLQLGCDMSTHSVVGIASLLDTQEGLHTAFAQELEQPLELEHAPRRRPLRAQLYHPEEPSSEIRQVYPASLEKQPMAKYDAAHGVLTPGESKKPVLWHLRPKYSLVVVLMQER